MRCTGFTYHLPRFLFYFTNILNIYYSMCPKAKMAQQIADHLAKQGLEAYLEWVLVDNVSPMSGLLLADDAPGSRLPRLVV